MKILVVDDEQVMRDLFKRVLSKERYEVVTAKDKEECLEVFKVGSFNLAMVDIMLPGVNGVELLKKLKQLDPDIEGMIITGYASLETAIEALRSGISEYISKPFDNLEDVLRVVNRLVEKQKLAVENKRLQEETHRQRDELEKRTSELQELKDQLEVKVAERAKELEAAQGRLVRSEKLATIGKLAGILGHELRNPLGTMKNTLYYINMLDIHKEAAEVKNQINILAEDINRCEMIINDILSFARVKEPTLSPVDVNKIVKDTLATINIPNKIKIKTDMEDLPKIKADALQISQVFSNIILNAIQAMPNGGSLTIATKFADTQGKSVCISFADTGYGIPQKNIGKIFEPLFTTKEVGTGLGLSTCLSIVESHGGTIQVQSKIKQGTTVTVILPMR